MGEKRDILCGEPGCLTRVSFWRQCPLSLCSADIGFCIFHGGEARAETEMRKHLERHPAQDSR